MGVGGGGGGMSSHHKYYCTPNRPICSYGDKAIHLTPSSENYVQKYQLQILQHSVG